MKKRFGFILGLLAGSAAAFLAFKRLDPKKREAIINDIDGRAARIKSRAIDYAFYASDAMNEASNNVHKHTGKMTEKAKRAMNGASSKVDQLKHHVDGHFGDTLSHKQGGTQFHTAADHLRSELNGSTDDDDIIVNADDALKAKSYLKTVVYYPDGSVDSLK